MPLRDVSFLKYLPRFFSHGYIVPICGGLGGQILGYNLFDYLKQKNINVYADILNLPNSNTYRLAKKGEGLNQHIWNLGYYGIDPNQDPRIICKNKRKRFGFTTLHEGQKQRSRLYVEANKNINQNLFPIKKEHQDIIKKTFRDQKILVVHVRQSDYLNVASLVIDQNYSTTLIQRLLSLNPERVIFVSDGKIKEKKLKKEIGFNIETFHSKDYFLIHALLRRANLLIASNSQFSLSAAYLGSSQLSFFPKNYFGKDYQCLNESYKSAFSYFVM